MRVFVNCERVNCVGSCGVTVSKVLVKKVGNMGKCTFYEDKMNQTYALGVTNHWYLGLITDVEKVSNFSNSISLK